MVNPFKTLGLAPEGLKNLSPSQLDTLIKGTFRLLSRLYHTDVGGSESRFKAIKAAFDELDDAARRSAYLAEYLVSRNDRAKKLERTLDQARDMSELLIDQIADLALSVSQGEQLVAQRTGYHLMVRDNSKRPFSVSVEVDGSTIIVPVATEKEAIDDSNSNTPTGWSYADGRWLVRDAKEPLRELTVFAPSAEIVTHNIRLLGTLNESLVQPDDSELRYLTKLKSSFGAPIYHKSLEQIEESALVEDRSHILSKRLGEPDPIRIGKLVGHALSDRSFRIVIPYLSLTELSPRRLLIAQSFEPYHQYLMLGRIQAIHVVST